MKRSKKHLPRRTPTQERSQARVQRILEAAAEVVGDVGYEAATTNAIAARARTSIGSLYQFFPNKTALMHALALRYMDELKGLFAVAVASGTDGLSWQQVIEKIIDTFAEFHQTRAGFKAVWFGGHLAPDLIATAFQCGNEISKNAVSYIEALVPDIDPARSALVARVSTEIVGALLVISTLDPRAGAAKDFIAEAKIACIAYLQRALGLPG